jgi:cell division transport system permease protein
MQRSISKKKLGNYPYTGVIASITLALLVSGLFGVLIIYSQELSKLVREQVRVQVYLKNGLTETQRLQIEKSIESLPFINSKEGIQFVSKEQAAERFIEETGEDFKEFLGENPLHDAYLVSIHPDYHALDKMKEASTELEKLNGVYQVFYLESLIESINKNINRISLVLLSIIAILLVTVILLINNTIRIALFSQRFLIRSMQLVGARRWFIQRPFLSRALLYGAIAGILASTILWALLKYAHQKIEDLALLMNEQHIYILAATLLMLGMCVAFLSTFFAIRRYLKMSLDELY